MQSKVPLSDYADILMGQSPKGDTCSNEIIGLPLLNGPTEFGSKYPTPTQFTTDPKRTSKVDDILFCVRGSTTGRMNYADQEYAIGRGIASIRGKNGYPTVFVRGLIERNLQQLLNIATGSTFPNVSRDMINSFEVENMSKENAVKIAHILSTLDDKIELNHKMSQTLEEMAQALFKSWFVDFDPVHAKADAKSDAELDAVAAELGIAKEVLELFPGEFVESEMGMIPLGWEVKELKDFGRVVTGKTPPKKIEDAYSDKGKPFITPTDVDNSLFITKTVRYLSDSGQLAVKNSKITAGSICVTCIGSQMGKTTVAPADSFTNQQINSIVLRKDNTRNYLLCNLRGRRKEIFLLGSGGGSTMPLLNKSSFEKVDILLPTAGVIEAFDSMMKDNISLVLKNDIESNNLSKLRDALLPKLLSGEQDVSKLTMETD